MAVKLLTLVDPRGSEGRAKLGIQSRALLDDAFSIGPSHLLRIWDAPDDSEASQILVVLDPPEVESIGAVVSAAGLRLDSVVPVISAQPTGDPQSTEAALLTALPETFPETLLSPAPIALSGVLLPILGIVYCPTCGGWGGHLFEHS